MTRPARLAARAVGVALLLAAGIAAAADQKAIVDQIKTHNQAATAAYSGGKWDEMKKAAEEAIALANDNGLSSHATLAQAYVLLGVAEVEAKHRDAGISAFVKALQVSAAAEVPSNMNKKAVKTAFAKAEDEDATASKEPPPEPKKADKAEKSEGKDKEKDKEKQAQAPTPEKDSVAKETSSAKETKEAKEKEAAAEKQAQAERDKQAKELAAAKESENKAAAAREKIEREKQDADKQIGEAKGRIAQLQKEKGDKEQELAAAHAAEKKEREAREKAEKAKADADKQIAELKARVQQLESENTDKNKQLAILRDEDKKEHEAREKLEKVSQESEAREKERKARESKESTEREKLVEGPDLPSRIPEPIHCTVPDEAPAGTDLYVHCAAQPTVGAKLIVFYFRPAGVVPYNAVLMDPTKKGWFVATIPGRRINGKFLHYYVEARDTRQEIAATNGKATSPNVLTVLPPGSAAVAAQTPASSSNGSLRQARASEKIARKRSKK